MGGSRSFVSNARAAATHLLDLLAALLRVLAGEAVAVHARQLRLHARVEEAPEHVQELQRVVVGVPQQLPDLTQPGVEGLVLASFLVLPVGREALLRDLVHAAGSDLDLHPATAMAHHPGVQRFNASSEGWKALAEWCIRKKWPINLHATEVVGRNHPGNVQTPLKDFLDMARNNPQLKLILAHWGGGLAFFELNPALRKNLKNVYYDTAATPLLYEPSIFRHMIGIVGADKILFGSDYPLRLYPKTQKDPDFSIFLNSIHQNTDLNSEECAAIMHRNLQTLLG